MKLKTLTLSNFRGFGAARESDSDFLETAVDIQFEDDLTVIAGVNGSGKSGILKALAGLASYLVPEITPAKRNVIAFDDDDIHHGKRSFTLSARFAGNIIETSAQIVRASPGLGQASNIQKKIEGLRTSRRNIQKDSTEDKSVGEHITFLEHLLTPSEDNFSYQTGSTEGAGEMDESPALLIVFYPTNRNFKGLPPRLAGAKATSPADAYAKALDKVEISLNDFANWFRAVRDGQIGSSEFSETLTNMLEKTITTMLPGFTGLDLEEKPKPHFTIDKEGQRFKLDQLSDGERALLALAFDLTRRLTIANPESQNPVAEGRALVMIDEIELHLHPKWQRQVMRHLNATFPRCQFIVTTHSPQIIGQAKAKKLRLLNISSDGRIEVIIPDQSFGMDSSWVLQNIMDCPARDYEAEQKLSAIFDAIDDESYSEAENLLSELSMSVGEFPELQEAQLFLDRIRMLSQVDEKD